MLTLEQKQKISEAVAGTCMGEHEMADEFDCDYDDILDAIVEIGEVERCTTCGWWCEIHELELVNDEHTCQECQ
jgi:hypothetical protein